MTKSKNTTSSKKTTKKTAAGKIAKAKAKKAPWGYKKDGTPRKKPGRRPTK